MPTTIKIIVVSHSPKWERGITLFKNEEENQKRWRRRMGRKKEQQKNRRKIYTITKGKKITSLWIFCTISMPSKCPPIINYSFGENNLSSCQNHTSQIISNSLTCSPNLALNLFSLCKEFIPSSTKKPIKTNSSTKSKLCPSYRTRGGQAFIIKSNQEERLSYLIALEELAFYKMSKDRFTNLFVDKDKNCDIGEEEAVRYYDFLKLNDGYVYWPVAIFEPYNF